MAEESVFLVTEVWLLPGQFELLKDYRKRTLDVLSPYRPEFVFHNHGFEWVSDDNEGSIPTGMEVLRFDNEADARAAIADLSTPELKAMERRVFSRVRSYFSRYAPSEGGRWARNRSKGQSI